MLPLRIAARFLRTSPGQSALIIGGIAVGIATQVFVGSLITSLQADLIDTTVGSSPHITLTAASEGGYVNGDIAFEAPKLERLVSTAVAVRTVSALYVSETDSVPLTLKGGDFAGLDTVYKLSDRLSVGTAGLDEGEAIVGVAFAEKYGIGPGDSLTLLLPSGDSQGLTVRAIFDLGVATANERIVFVDPAFAAIALGLTPDEYTSIELQLTDVFASSEVAPRLASEFGVTAADWQEQNAELLSGLQAQSASSAMIQTFVLVAVALGIASTLAISAVQKTRQIGILKAMGMSDGSSGRIFLWQAAMLGGGGTLCGIALGFALIWGFSAAPVPFSIAPEPTFVVISGFVGVLVALVSSIIPTRRTARLDPIEVIQNG